jgi:hypothetical protein
VHNVSNHNTENWNFNRLGGADNLNGAIIMLSVEPLELSFHLLVVYSTHGDNNEDSYDDGDAFNPFDFGAAITASVRGTEFSRAIVSGQISAQTVSLH